MLSTVRAWRPLRAGPPGQVSVAQGGVEPPASLDLSEGGLPDCLPGHSRPPRCQRAVGQSARRESNPPVRRGGPVPGPLGHGHVWFSGRRGSRTLKARRSSGFGPGAVAYRLALPFAVWMAGFEPAWSGFRRRRMKPGSPTSRATFTPTPRPTKKARGRVTPGLQGLCPEGSGVTVAEGTRAAPRPAGQRGPLRSSTHNGSWRDWLPS